MIRPRFSAGESDLSVSYAPDEESIAFPRFGPPHDHRVVRGIAAAAAALLLLAAAALLFVEHRYDGQVYPDISAGNIALGGLSFDEAQETLQGVAAQHESQTVTLKYGDQTWNPTYADLGISINVDRTLNAAFDIGREDTARGRLGSFTDLIQGTRYVPLSVSFDKRQLDSWLDTVDSDLGLVPHNAYLVIDGTDVTVVPELDGTVVDRDQLARTILAGASTLSIPDAALPVTSTRAIVRTEDLAGAQAKVESALAKPVKLRYAGKKWTLKPEELSKFIVQSTDPNLTGAAAFTVSTDEAGLAEWLNQLLKDDVNQPSVDAKIAWSNDRNNVIATEPSQDGAKLRPASLAEGVAQSFWSNHKTIEVPITVIHPKIDSKHLDALGITTRLAVGDSNYVGSSESRAINIQVGASLLDGTLIAPGDTFSFNHAIGVIEADKGYVEAPVIAGERIGRDVGGGICQVSTTVFRAALTGGLPITEWHPHTYRLAFYEQDGWPPGFDASILQPNDDPLNGGDFKFQNPTDSWMLVESYVEDQHVYVIIYGPDLGYTVDFSDPWISDPIPPPDQALEIVDDSLEPGTVQQTELAQSGLEVVFDRSVTDREGDVVVSDNWDSYFASRPNVWKVSPDMEGESPASQSADSDSDSGDDSASD